MPIFIGLTSKKRFVLFVQHFCFVLWCYTICLLFTLKGKKSTCFHFCYLSFSFFFWSKMFCWFNWRCQLATTFLFYEVEIGFQWFVKSPFRLLHRMITIINVVSSRPCTANVSFLYSDQFTSQIDNRLCKEYMF